MAAIERRLLRLERENSPALPPVYVAGTDEAECERLELQIRKTGKVLPGQPAVLVITGVPRSKDTGA